MFEIMMVTNGWIINGVQIDKPIVTIDLLDDVTVRALCSKEIPTVTFVSSPTTNNANISALAYLNKIQAHFDSDIISPQINNFQTVQPLTVKMIRNPIITKSGTSGSMRSEMDYIINDPSLNGVQVEYRARIIDPLTSVILGIKQRFITITPGDPFPSRSMNILYPNYDNHPNVIADFALIKNLTVKSNVLKFNLTLFTSANNFEVVGTFSDGHTITGIMTKVEHDKFLTIVETQFPNSI